MCGKVCKTAKSAKPTDNEGKKFAKIWKRFRHFIGMTQEDVGIALKSDASAVSNFEKCNFGKVDWMRMRKKKETFMKDVKEQLGLKEGEEPSEIKTRARQLLEDKMVLFNKIKEMKAEIGINAEKIANLECDVGVNVIDPPASISEFPSEIKNEPSSQPDAREKDRDEEQRKRGHFEWFKKHLKDRCRQRHFVYIIIHPITKKLVYVGESSDVAARMACHRRNPKSSVYELFKEFPTLTSQIIFTGSFYACKAVESILINLQEELGFDLMNVCKEGTSVTPKKKNFSQIEEDVQVCIGDFPLKVDAPAHERLLSAVKFMLDHTVGGNEVGFSGRQSIWSKLSATLIQIDSKEADGTEESGLTVDKPFDDIDLEPAEEINDMTKFIKKFREFREYFNLSAKDIGVVTERTVNHFENSIVMRESAKQRNIKILGKFMEDYQRKHGEMVKTNYLEMLVTCVEKRLEEYRKYLDDYLKLKLENQHRVIAGLEFEKELHPRIYGTEVEDVKPEHLSQQSQAREDYIWLRRLLKDRDGKAHFVYLVKDPITGKYVYGGESGDIEYRIPVHRGSTTSSIYDFLQQHDKVEVLQLYSGSYYACKTIETLIIALEDEFECMDLLNKGKNTRKTTPKKKKYVNVGDDVFALPEEFVISEAETRAKVTDALKCLLDDANKENDVITFTRSGSTRKRPRRATDGGDEPTVNLKKVKREINDDGNDEYLNNWEFADQS